MKKHIITSGCSFTNCGKSWPYHIEGHEVHNVGTVGAGNGYISRAAIWQCEDLIKRGIPSKDIEIIIMWSGIDRFEVYHQKKIHYIKIILVVIKIDGGCQIMFDL